MQTSVNNNLESIFLRTFEILGPFWLPIKSEFFKSFGIQGEVPVEMLSYFPMLLRQKYKEISEKQYFYEVADFEWALYSVPIDPLREDQFLSFQRGQVPLLNPVARILRFQNKVSHWYWSLEEPKDKPVPKPELLIISRNLEQKKVLVFEPNQHHAMCIDLVTEVGVSLDQIKEELQQKGIEADRVLEELIARNIILF